MTVEAMTTVSSAGRGYLYYNTLQYTTPFYHTLCYNTLQSTTPLYNILYYHIL